MEDTDDWTAAGVGSDPAWEKDTTASSPPSLTLWPLPRSPNSSCSASSPTPDFNAGRSSRSPLFFTPRFQTFLGVAFHALCMQPKSCGPPERNKAACNRGNAAQQRLTTSRWRTAALQEACAQVLFSFQTERTAAKKNINGLYDTKKKFSLQQAHFCSHLFFSATMPWSNKCLSTIRKPNQDFSHRCPLTPSAVKETLHFAINSHFGQNVKGQTVRKLLLPEQTINFFPVFHIVKNFVCLSGIGFSLSCC